MVKVTALNSLEKKSFYSFLGLYIISSFLFILLTGYLYNSAQVTTLEKNEYYRLQHIADNLSQKIIHAHMTGTKLVMPKVEKGINITLIDTNDKVVYGNPFHSYKPTKAEYITEETHNILISDAPQEHLNIKFVVVHSSYLDTQIKSLKKNIIRFMIIATLAIAVLAWILSLLFMKPLRQKIKQVEDFVHDTAHELNTPITALSMSVSRALKKEVYDEKILKNISISTKQLFDIYNALSYISFDDKTTKEEATEIDICKVIQKSVAYYKELAQSKKIDIEVECKEFIFKIDETKLTMLFGNLINNAIKYSNYNSKIEIIFKDGIFKIQDYGIGIEDKKLTKIFDRFNRATDYSGGFGLGLSIVQKISNEYDLKLNVKSELDKGTIFCVEFK